jgi:hypothetical protein
MPYNKIKADLPKLSATKSRVFVYRTFNAIALVHPRVVLIDGKPFGDALTGTASYRDVGPGEHLFSIVDRKSKLRVQLKPGKVTFLRVTILTASDSGIDTAIKVIPNKTAEADLHGINVIEAKVRNLVK